jgi:hypothetical protein
MPEAHDPQALPEGATGVSHILLSAVRGESERITLGDIIGALDARAFGLATLMFALPSVVPMPPGVPTIVGLALLMVSVQMVIGRQELWIPAFMARWSFPRASLVSAMEGLTPRLRTLETIARPRLMPVTGTVGTVLIGVIILIMALILILPLPPGVNFPPALACAILGMGLAERDGVIVLVGAAGSILALFAAWAVTVGFITYLPVISDWIGRTLGF